MSKYHIFFCQTFVTLCLEALKRMTNANPLSKKKDLREMVNNIEMILEKKLQMFKKIINFSFFVSDKDLRFFENHFHREFQKKRNVFIDTFDTVCIR